MTSRRARRDAAAHAAAGSRRELHRLALHQQLRRAVDRAELQVRERSRQGAGPDRVVQPDRSGLPAAGVEPGHQPGLHHAALAGAGQQREPAPDPHGRRLHEPLRRGGPLRRRQIRDLPVRPDARRGRDGQRRVGRERRLDVPDRRRRRREAGADPVLRRARAEQRSRGPRCRCGSRTRARGRRSRPSSRTLHLGAVFKRQWIFGAHFIDVFANDNERSTAFTESTFDTAARPRRIHDAAAGVRASIQRAAPAHHGLRR